MKLSYTLITLGSALTLMALSAQAQRAVGRWNLGEQDPGAAAGSAGNAATADAIGTNALAATGQPVYSANVPPGGSTLAMSFDGASFYQGSVVGNAAGFDALYTNLNFNHFSLSYDVYMTAAGGSGFSFPVSIGRNGAGLAPVEIGGVWYLIHQGVANSAAGPAVAFNTWTHLDLVRRDFGSGVISVLFVNGTAAITNATTPGTPTDFLTLGANELGSAVPGNVEGYFQGVIDNVVITNLDLGGAPTLAGLTAAPGTIYTGNSILLSAAGVGGDPTARNFAWRRDGAVVTNTATASVTLVNATTNLSGSYDVVLTNLYGAVTSAVVAVVVRGPAASGGRDVARYRLGDDDSGAVAGNPGDATTKDALGAADLSAFGTPSYSSNVPNGGGAFSMSFDGASFYEGSTNELADLYGKLDFNNFSLSGDVFVAALGASGFSFPLSMGKNGTGGFTIVEIGGRWYILHQNVVQSAAGFPVTLNQWTHLELQRRVFGTGVQSRLFVDGVDVGVQATPGPALPIAPILSVGANATGDGVTPEGYFNGQIDNVVIHDYSAGQPPRISQALSVTPVNFVAVGEAFTLAAAGVSGDLPLTYLWRLNGSVATNSGNLAQVTFANVALAQSGTYDLVVTNQFGAATSSVAVVTVLAPGLSVGTTVAQYRLGEDDPGAAAGAAGAAQTKDAVGLNDLPAFGSPFYSNNVPPGGSVLSLAFDGATYYQAGGETLGKFYATIDFNNFSAACDVFMTAPGAPGFSFPLSVGGTGSAGGGLAVVEVGGVWEIIHHGVQLSTGGPSVNLNTWTHLEMQRWNFGSGVQTRLLIDGVDSGLFLAPAPLGPGAFFTIGANPNPGASGGTEGYFNGLVDNVTLKSYTVVPPQLNSLRLTDGQARAQGTGRPAASGTLWRTSSLGPASWVQVTHGSFGPDGQILLVDPAPPAAGAYYRIGSP